MAQIRASRLGLGCARGVGRTVTGSAMLVRPGLGELTGGFGALARPLASLAVSRIRASSLGLGCTRRMGCTRGVGRTVTVGTVRVRPGLGELTGGFGALARPFASRAVARIRASGLGLGCTRRMGCIRSISRAVTVDTVRVRPGLRDLTGSFGALARPLASLAVSRIRVSSLGLGCTRRMGCIRSISRAVTVDTVRVRLGLGDLTGSFGALARPFASLAVARIRASGIGLGCTRRMGCTPGVGRAVTVGTVRVRPGLRDLTGSFGALARPFASRAVARIRASGLGLGCTRRMGCIRGVGRAVTVDTVRVRPGLRDLTGSFGALARPLASLAVAGLRASGLGLRCLRRMGCARTVGRAVTGSTVRVRFRATLALARRIRIRS